MWGLQNCPLFCSPCPTPLPRSHLVSRWGGERSQQAKGHDGGWDRKEGDVGRSLQSKAPPQRWGGQLSAAAAESAHGPPDPGVPGPQLSSALLPLGPGLGGGRGEEAGPVWEGSGLLGQPMAGRLRSQTRPGPRRPPCPQSPTHGGNCPPALAAAAFPSAPPQLPAPRY